ncbi:hypothetical protein [Scytonema sp. NUACC21]
MTNNTRTKADFSRYLENPTSIPLTPVATTPEEQRTSSPTRREALISPPSLRPSNTPAQPKLSITFLYRGCASLG